MYLTCPEYSASASGVCIASDHTAKAHLVLSTVHVSCDVGLDCEWVSKGKENRPVALLQVATPHRDCYLIRLNKLQSVPDCLLRILSDER